MYIIKNDDHEIHYELIFNPKTNKLTNSYFRRVEKDGSISEEVFINNYFDDLNRVVLTTVKTSLDFYKFLEISYNEAGKAKYSYDW